MLSSRFLQAARRTSSTAGSTTRRSAATTGCSTSYSVDARLGDAHAGALMCLLALVLVGTVVLFKMVPTGFIPTQDTGQINVTTEAAQGTSFQRHGAAPAAGRGDRAARHEHRQRSCRRSAVAAAVGATNEGRLTHRLKPRGQRLSADEIVNELRREAVAHPGHARRSCRSRRRSRSAAAARRASISSRCRRPTSRRCIRRRRSSWTRARAVAAAAGRDERPADHQSAGRTCRSTATRAAAFGVTAQQIESALYDAYGSRQVSTIYTPNNQYWVIMELLPQYQQDIIGAAACCTCGRRSGTSSR